MKECCVITIKKEVQIKRLEGGKKRKFEKGEIHFPIGKLKNNILNEPAFLVEVDDERYIIENKDCHVKEMDSQKFLEFMQELVGPEFEILGFEE